jgi:hypothetical protein
MGLQEVYCPMDRLAIDLTGPHPPSHKRNIYILTVTDCMTRYLIAVPLRNKYARTVASALLRHVFCRLGLCREILSDQGKEFRNDLLYSLTDMFNIRLRKTTPYRAQSNGRAERAHKDMHAMFAKLTEGDPSHWDEVLDAIVLAYNGSVNRSTGYSPNFLMFGREALTPLDLCLPRDGPEVGLDRQTYVEYVNRLHQTLQEVYEAARLQSLEAAEYRKKKYDKTVKPLVLHEGDVVRLKRESLKPGEYRKWSLLYEGPFIVVEKLSDVNYIIQRHPAGERRTVHVDRLKRF